MTITPEQEAGLRQGLAERLLVDPTHVDTRPTLDFDRRFLVMPTAPVEHDFADPIRVIGHYVARGGVFRVGVLGYDKTRLDADQQRVIVFTNVRENDTHTWQPPTTYIGGALIGRLQADGTIRYVDDGADLPVNNYSRPCIPGERAPGEEPLSALPPVADQPA